MTSDGKYTVVFTTALGRRDIREEGVEEARISTVAAAARPILRNGHLPAGMLEPRLPLHFVRILLTIRLPSPNMFFCNNFPTP